MVPIGKQLQPLLLAGNSASERNYQQLDLNGGTAFYRIKQIDKNGNFIYTGTERTNCVVKTITSVIYPVPTRDVLTVVIKSDRDVDTRLMVFDISGKMVKEVRASVLNGNNTFKVNLAGLTSGDYIIKNSDPAIDLNQSVYNSQVITAKKSYKKAPLHFSGAFLYNQIIQGKKNPAVAGFFLPCII